MPCSNWWKRDFPSKAGQSEVEPGYKMDIMSRNRLRTLHTVWQFKSNFSFLPHKNFPGLHHMMEQYASKGLWIKFKKTIYNPRAAPRSSRWHFNKTYSNRLLFLVVIRVCNFKSWMLVNSINNVPVAVDCLCTTDTKSSHNIICWPPRQPSNCTGKSDIWWTWTVWAIPWSSFRATCGNIQWTKQGSETSERCVCHSVCPPEVETSKFSVNHGSD